MLPLDTLGFRPHMTLSLDSPWEEQTCSLTRKEVARYLTLMLFGLTQIGSNKSHLHKIHNAPDIVGRVYKMFVLDAPDESLGADICETLDILSDVKRVCQTINLLNVPTFVWISVPNDEQVKRTKIRFKFNTAIATQANAFKPENNFLSSLIERISKFGLTSSSFVLTHANTGNGIALRRRFLIPDGMRVDEVRREGLRYSGRLHAYERSEDQYLDTITTRWDGQAVYVYAPTPHRIPFSLRIVMSPKRSMFAPAFIASLVSFVISEIIALSIKDSSGVNVPFQGFTPLATLVPAFIVSYVLVSQEHEAVNLALGTRRVLLGFGAVLSVLFLVALTIDMADKKASVTSQKVLFLYTIIQLALLLFFLFDIVRIQLWRWAVCRKSYELNLLVLFTVLNWISIIVAIYNCWLFSEIYPYIILFKVVFAIASVLLAEAVLLTYVSEWS